jgi:hypothetical protein
MAGYDLADMSIKRQSLDAPSALKVGCNTVCITGVNMTISLRLDEGLKKRLASAAKARGISKSELIRACLDEYLNAHERDLTAWDMGKD